MSEDWELNTLREYPFWLIDCTSDPHRQAASLDMRITDKRLPQAPSKIQNLLSGIKSLTDSAVQSARVNTEAADMF